MESSWDVDAGKDNDESSHRSLFEGELGELVGLQHILCDVVGKTHSDWPELRYVFTYICFFFIPVYDDTMHPLDNSIKIQEIFQTNIDIRFVFIFLIYATC